MIVNCINLLHRTDRKENAIAQAQQQGFEIKLWPGVEDQPRPKGIMKAHLSIIKYAKEKKLSEITIMEDDCVFTAPDAFDFYLKQKPDDFDVYWGGIYSGQLEGNRIINGISGMTLYTVKEHFYDFILGLYEENLPNSYLYHIDRRLGGFAFEKNYRVCLPFPTYQMHGYSDNHKRTTQLDLYHQRWEYYGSRPPLSTASI